MHVRTSHYLTSIYEWFAINIGSSLSADAKEKMIERVRKVGWTKARCLVGVATSDDMDQWFEKSENVTTSELTTLAKQALMIKNGKDPKEVASVKRFGFTVEDEAYDTIQQALEIGSEQLESDKKGHVIAMICQDYLATHMAHAGDSPHARTKYFDRIAAQFGVNLIVLDKETNKVIQGKEILDSLSQGARD